MRDLIEPVSPIIAGFIIWFIGTILNVSHILGSIIVYMPLLLLTIYLCEHIGKKLLITEEWIFLVREAAVLILNCAKYVPKTLPAEEEQIINGNTMEKKIQKAFILAFM